MTTDNRPTMDDLVAALDAQAPKVIPPEELPPFDPTNTFMQESGPQAMAVAIHVLTGRDPDGMQVALMALTIRTGESTTRYVMPRDYAQQVCTQMQTALTHMPSITIADAGDLPLLNRQQRRAEQRRAAH